MNQIMLRACPFAILYIFKPLKYSCVNYDNNNNNNNNNSDDNKYISKCGIQKKTEFRKKWIFVNILYKID